MFCNIYRLFESGFKKSKPIGPVSGNLVLFKCDDGTNREYRIRAVLRNADGQSILPMLDRAVVERITNNAGIVITGTELVARSKSIKANVEHYPQIWWCEVLPTP